MGKKYYDSLMDERNVLFHLFFMLKARSLSSMSWVIKATEIMRKLITNLYVVFSKDPPKNQMKIETFKENINVVYGPCRREELSANSSKQTLFCDEFVELQHSGSIHQPSPCLPNECV